jgi:hypothetical protein
MRTNFDSDAAYNAIVPTLLMVVLQLSAIVMTNTHPITMLNDGGSVSLAIRKLAVAAIPGPSSSIRVDAAVWPFPPDGYSADFAVAAQDWAKRFVVPDVTCHSVNLDFYVSPLVALETRSYRSNQRWTTRPP